jgi:molecular chaperone GrpE
MTKPAPNPQDQEPRTEEQQAAAPSGEGGVSGPEGDGASGNQGVEALRARLETAEREREEYLEMAQRTRADFENYQKRALRDQIQERRYAQAPLAGDILQVLDNLERALAAARQAGDEGPLVQGVLLVENQIQDVLRRHGVTRIEAEGHPFDPNLHQAMMQQPSGEHPPQTVLQVFEQGYLLHDRVLRPARVVVSVQSESADKNQSSEE